LGLTPWCVPLSHALRFEKIRWMISSTMSVDELEARERAEKWLRRDDGSIATRENSINEETMALDVVELLDDVARLRVANAALNERLHALPNTMRDAERNGL
jgi:hypothetical protein